MAPVERRGRGHEVAEALFLDNVLIEASDQVTVLLLQEVDAEALLRHLTQERGQLELDVQALLALFNIPRFIAV